MPKRFDVNLDGADENSEEEDKQPINEGPSRADKAIEAARDMQSNRTLREKYASRAFWFAVGSVVFWMFIVVWMGASTYYKTTPLFSDKVAIAITTATCVNLFAAFLGVIRGLFPANGNGGAK